MHITHQPMEDLPQGQLSSVLPPHFVHRGGKANVGTSEGVAQHANLFCVCYPPGGWHCTKPCLGWIAAAPYPLPVACSKFKSGKWMQRLNATQNMLQMWITSSCSMRQHFCRAQAAGLEQARPVTLLWDWMELQSMICLLSAHSHTNQYCNHLYLKASHTIRQEHLEIPPSSPLWLRAGPLYPKIPILPWDKSSDLTKFHMQPRGRLSSLTQSCLHLAFLWLLYFANKSFFPFHLSLPLPQTYNPIGRATI